jgi:twitching motility protein PilT
VSQREVNHDTHGWDIALRSALREDPDVVLVGEMRDYETIAAAITVAETGHLVFGTLHTATAAQTIDRIIDVFPAHQQAQIRQQLSAVLEAVVSQRLIPMIGGGRVAATEIMLANSAIRNLIREEKAFQIDNVIQTSAEQGMSLIETSLVSLVQRGAISDELARTYAFRPDTYDKLSGKG